MAAEKQCFPLIAGAGEQGHKELPPMTEGFRESTQRWRGLLPDLKRRGLKQNPQPVMSDNHHGRCRQPPWPVGLYGRRACPCGGQPHRPD